MVRPDGSDVHQITRQPLGNLMTATWTPDQRRAFVAHDVNGVQRLEVLDASGQGAAKRRSRRVIDIDQAVVPSADRRRDPDPRDRSTGLGPLRHAHRRLRASACSPRRSLPRLRTDDQDLNHSCLLARRDADLLQPIHARGRDDPGLGDERRRIRPAPLQPVGPRVLLVGGRDGPVSGRAVGRDVARAAPRRRTAGNGRSRSSRPTGRATGARSGPSSRAPAHWLWAPDSSRSW